MNFSDKLCAAIKTKRTPLMVGLDPRVDLLPDQLKPASDSHGDVAVAFQQFCCDIIDVVEPLVPVVKPNAAFFEALGPAGMSALAGVNKYAQEKGLLVLMDAKRGDIGSTAEAYAQAFLTRDNDWHSDALTVNPFLGCDTIKPMMKVATENETGLFVLVKTSNPGSGDLQDLQCDGNTISERMADSVERFCVDTLGSSGYGICGAVVGATYPEQLARLRERMPHSILLIPGVGAQGGTASDVAAAFDEQGLGAIINSSRGIIFAFRQEQSNNSSSWQDPVEQATLELIAQLRRDTPARCLGN